MAGHNQSVPRRSYIPKKKKKEFSTTEGTSGVRRESPAVPARSQASSSRSNHSSNSVGVWRIVAPGACPGMVVADRRRSTSTLAGWWSSMHQLASILLRKEIRDTQLTIWWWRPYSLQVGSGQAPDRRDLGGWVIRTGGSGFQSPRRRPRTKLPIARWNGLRIAQYGIRSCAAQETLLKDFLLEIDLDSTCNQWRNPPNSGVAFAAHRGRVFASGHAFLGYLWQTRFLQIPHGSFLGIPSLTGSQAGIVLANEPVLEFERQQCRESHRFDFEDSIFSLNMDGILLLTLRPRRALLQAAAPATSSNTTRNLLWLYIVASVFIVVVVVIAACCCWRCYKVKRDQRPRGKPVPLSEESVSDVLGGGNRAAKVIPYETVVQATNDFDLTQKVGDGRFGPVFQGEMSDGTEVAVRRLPLNSRQGKREFVKGVKNMMEAHHRNVVRLIGCSYTTSRLLVYEHLPNGNLAKILFDRKKTFEWRSRFDVLLGVANGLAYLHEEPDSIFAHGDIKAGNIMLDKIMKPKIADWGLAALFRNDQGEVKPRNMVSAGYMSLELALDGQLSAKSDVFSFGILCLEVISGRQNTDINLLGTEMQTLLSWAWSLQTKRRQLDMLDERLRDNCDEEQVLKVFCIALLSTQDSTAARPSMSRIAAMLRDEEPLPQLPAKPEAVKSLGLCDQNVSGTFTSSFVTPKFVTPSKKWASKKYRASDFRFNNDPSDRDGVYRF